MNKAQPRDHVVRARATDKQWRKLKTLAIERDMEIRELVTAALQTSPLTEKVFR
jgi:hypothetical protein